MLVFFLLSAHRPGIEERKEAMVCTPPDSAMRIFGRGSVDKQQVGTFFPHSDVTFFSKEEEGAGKKGTVDTWWHFCLVRFLLLPSPF